MSRSNPTTHSNHPCQRWHDWNGERGEITYYDRQLEKNITVADGFTFMLLDQLATVKGWHDASDSGIHSNEVRDTKQEVLIVKAFKGGVIAEGFYATIRDRINSLGGHFTANCYIAFRDNGLLALGSIQFKGAALSKWMDFTKENRSELYKKSIQIKGFTEGKKGRITYRTPNFHIRDITPETNDEATTLDIELQKYLAQYFNKPKVEQSAASTTQTDPNADLQRAAAEANAAHDAEDLDPPF
jgi:hypothetical protein